MGRARESERWEGGWLIIYSFVAGGSTGLKDGFEGQHLLLLPLDQSDNCEIFCGDGAGVWEIRMKEDIYKVNEVFMSLTSTW